MLGSSGTVVRVDELKDYMTSLGRCMEQILCGALFDSNISSSLNSGETAEDKEGSKHFHKHLSTFLDDNDITGAETVCYLLYFPSVLCCTQSF
jgi:hypothetical protein